MLILIYRCLSECCFWCPLLHNVTRFSFTFNWPIVFIITIVLTMETIVTVVQTIVPFLILFIKYFFNAHMFLSKKNKLLAARYDRNADDLFQALGWHKLKHQRLVSTSITMYKTVHGMTPEYLSS